MKKADTALMKASTAVKNLMQHKKAVKPATGTALSPESMAPISTLHTKANNESLPALEDYRDNDNVQDECQSNKDDDGRDTNTGPESEASEITEEAHLGTVCMLEDLLSNAGSMGALWHHIWKCWGDEVLAAADAAKDLKKSHDIVEKELTKQKLKNGSTVMMLKRFGSKIISYSTYPHTKMEVRLRFQVPDENWPSTALHPPFNYSLLNTYSLILWQKFDGMLSFATSAWTSPNHHVYVALAVHFVHDNGMPIRMVLDFIEVPKSHTGKNLAEALLKIIEDFAISDKILGLTCDNVTNNNTMVNDLANHIPSFPGQSSPS
ncbi:uncharacterized protein ARMOST_07710 [Armillaria ostoyae]|uniref:HAT C-terminal dimerisation domain-containing protein n=1 Tax=Armillaria ostoyae TaxID=47428 RepID=A0A284R6M8_ARMOS|nr:uncharacterized protein ARMOST_07710 [Armillaria ostoyae]